MTWWNMIEHCPWWTGGHKTWWKLVEHDGTSCLETLILSGLWVTEQGRMGLLGRVGDMEHGISSVEHCSSLGCRSG